MSNIAKEKEGKSVVIVGAGAAGITCAYTLMKGSSNSSSSSSNKEHNKIKDITILEANDYIGGRIRNFKFEGHTVEMGANWISGLETAFNNPIWKLAQEINLIGHTSERENPDQVGRGPAFPGRNQGQRRWGSETGQFFPAGHQGLGARRFEAG